MVFQGSFKGISRLFFGCFKEVPRKFHGRLKDVSKKFPVCVESISRVFQGSCMGIKEVSCGYQERFNQGLLGACKYYMSTLGGGGSEGNAYFAYVKDQNSYSPGNGF